MSNKIKYEKTIIKNGNFTLIKKKIYAWLEKENARITYSDENKIIAIHQYGVDKKPFKKEIEIKVEEMANGIHVFFTINRTINYTPNASVIYWGLFEDFFTFIGADVSVQMIKRWYPIEEINRLIRSSWSAILIFCIIGLLFLSIIDISLIGGLLGGFCFFIPAIIIFQGIQKHKKLRNRVWDL